MREVLLVTGVALLAVAIANAIGSFSNQPQKAVVVDGKVVWCS